MTDPTPEYDSWAWLYDRTLGPDYSARKMDAFTRIALGRLPRGARVLDLCCGTGQMMAPMLARRLDVTGLDLSADMLAHARQNAGAATLIQGDARDFTLPEPVAAVICASASLNHMATAADLARVFGAVFHALRPGGVFAFDINHPAQMEKHWQGQPAAGDIQGDHAWMITPTYDPTRRRGGFRVDMYRRPDTGGSRAGTGLSRALMRRPLARRLKLARLTRFDQHHRDWAHKRMEFPVYGHGIPEVLALLDQAGFDARCETLSGQPDVTADSAALFVARKRGQELERSAAE